MARPARRAAPACWATSATRVLLSFLVLLIVSTAASVIVLREVLISRIDDEVPERLTDDIDALQALAEGDPATGEPSKGLEQLFDAYLAARAPIADAAPATFVDDEPHASQSADSDLEPLGTALDDRPVAHQRTIRRPGRRPSFHRRAR